MPKTNNSYDLFFNDQGWVVRINYNSGPPVVIEYEDDFRSAVHTFKGFIHTGDDCSWAHLEHDPATDTTLTMWILPT